jgi:hypothetical protein
MCSYLCDTWNAIILDAVELTNTVSVHGSSIAHEIICDMNYEIVTPVSDDSKTWNGPVECKDSPLITIWGKSRVLN